ncbi:DnaB-like replicative helicase [Planktothrix phage PaV-LD]|uniref:DnaB-like replicative helicase n=1 Tax=Planktothrix phage PaV-LD TaxID=994601 RepID=UPI000243C844|nr:DnaB-like replicative helicase [Planktothrix phage PaV-LD]ADZ31514.1 replicative DNA helicase [Planktothrix phage PaV-LD]
METIIMQNVEAEQAVLGAILLDPEAMGRVAETLTAKSFSLRSHQTIYKAALALHSEGVTTDLMTVTTWLSDQKLLEKAGGQLGLTQLLDRTVSAVNIDQYGLLIADKQTRRNLIESAHKIIELAEDTSQPLETIIQRSEEQIANISQSKSQQDLVSIGETLIDTFQEIEDRSESKIPPGVPSGFYDLDAMTGGFQHTDLIIVAGRPAMGKSSLALNFGYNIAKKGLPVAVFSLEMSRGQLVQRLLSSEAKIESTRIRSGNIQQEEWEPLTTAISSLAELPIFIDDTSNPTVNEIKKKAQKLQAENDGKLGLILIDYLQLMDGGSDNRVQELSRITRGLKGMAKDLNVPVIALSQLSRAVESRTNKRPMLSDLRESGCLTGDSLITLADTGLQVPIKELVGKSGFLVWALNEETMKLENAVVSNAFSTGVKPVFTLTTRLGRKIKATANHKFLTIEGWKRLDELHGGCPIALPSFTIENSDVYWDEIVSIIPTGEEEVFDLTVPGLHNFVANNIVVHNSTEQDADLVMMIYRDDYYNPNTSDEGIAELILAKHRNGPTGTVKLLFDSQFTQFKNLVRGMN